MPPSVARRATCCSPCGAAAPSTRATWSATHRWPSGSWPRLDWSDATMDDDLERFLRPVREHLDDAVRELTAGRKRTHWMWFVFPQLRVLGRSDMAVRYGLADLDEARRFLAHDELGRNYQRLVAIVHH